MKGNAYTAATWNKRAEEIKQALAQQEVSRANAQMAGKVMSAFTIWAMLNGVGHGSGGGLGISIGTGTLLGGGGGKNKQLYRQSEVWQVVQLSGTQHPLKGF